VNTPPPHNLDSLHSQLRQTAIQENRVQLALEHGRQNGERLAVVEGNVRGFDEKLDRVLIEIGKLTVVLPMDRWLHRAALLSVTLAGVMTGAWIAYQAWKA
jgi:hypothetical protein